MFSGLTLVSNHDHILSTIKSLLMRRFQVDEQIAVIPAIKEFMNGRRVAHLIRPDSG